MRRRSARLFGVPARKSAQDRKREKIIVQSLEMAETIYLQGRESVMPSYDDRFNLQCAVEALRALAVIVGSERHCPAVAVLVRLLHERAGA